ncbi:MAG: low molecular weight protein arginine phosphatase [Candidatus Eisenbacteria bacterium]
MVRVLFVCTGNTCRSPMAAGILRRLAGAAAPPDLAGSDVASAGTMASAGHTATPEARAVSEEMGIDIGSHRARQVDAGMIAESDLVLVMEKRHRLSLLALAPQAAPRIHLLGEFALGEEDLEVPDPIGQGMASYRETRDLLRTLLDRVWERLVDRTRRPSGHDGGHAGE